MSLLRRTILVALSISFFSGVAGYCMETDNLTGRHDKLAKLPDSTAILDGVVNSRILLAIQETNVKGGLCDRNELVRNLRYELNRNPVGEIERFGEFDPSVTRYLSPFDKSIYGRVAEAKNLSVPVKLFLFIGIKASSIRLNNQIIGTDKLGHFFSQGYEYIFQKDWRDALLYGAKLEKGFYGFENSGVSSYADLNANFGGYLFWKNLTDGKNPYVACVHGQFVQKRPFTWATYVNAAWDEGINCSEYVSKEFGELVEAQEVANKVKCPAEPEACKKLVQEPCAFYLVSNECYKVAGVPKVENREACARFFDEYSGVGQCQMQMESWNGFVDKADEVWGSIIFPAYSVRQKWRGTSP